MEFLKSLLLVIFVPIVVSTLSFASQYGSHNTKMETLITHQASILENQKQTNNTLATLVANQSNQAKEIEEIKLDSKETKRNLSDINRELGILISVESRVDRLEEAVYN